LTSSPAVPQRYTLPAQRRLRRKTDFEAVRAQGQRLANGFFSVTLKPNEEKLPRLGLAVSIKTTGSGVERNRIRRAIRESFRLHQHELPHVDMVVSARTRARGASSGELRAALDLLWTDLIKLCARSPNF
jgi:ribonuclease P protein component